MNSFQIDAIMVEEFGGFPRELRAVVEAAAWRAIEAADATTETEVRNEVQHVALLWDDAIGE